MDNITLHSIHGFLLFLVNVVVMPLWVVNAVGFYKLNKKVTGFTIISIIGFLFSFTVLLAYFLKGWNT